MELIETLDALLARILGPWGAATLLVIVVYFVWKLFREKQKDEREAVARVTGLTEAVTSLAGSVRELIAEVREANRRPTRR